MPILPHSNLDLIPYCAEQLHLDLRKIQAVKNLVVTESSRKIGLDNKQYGYKRCKIQRLKVIEGKEPCYFLRYVLIRSCKKPRPYPVNWSRAEGMAKMLTDTFFVV